MQPFHEQGGQVAGVYLHRFEGEQRDPEILQLLDGIDSLLGSFPELAEEYSVWKAHNMALADAGMKPTEVPLTLQHYDKVAILEERTNYMLYKGGTEDYDTVVVTAEEAASIDVLKLGPDSPALSLEATSFLMEVCGFFDTEAENTESGPGGGINC